MELIRMIAYRAGIGDLLAEGVDRMAAYIGSGAREYAMTIKGIEMPGYDPRVRPLHGLGMVVSALGVVTATARPSMPASSPPTGKGKTWWAR